MTYKLQLKDGTEIRLKDGVWMCADTLIRDIVRDQFPVPASPAIPWPEWVAVQNFLKGTPGSVLVEGDHPAEYGAEQGMVIPQDPSKAFREMRAKAQHRSLEAKRLPFDRALEHALKQAFAQQEKAALAALDAASEEA